MTKAESAEQKRMEDEAKALFETAKPFLESAHAIDADDLETMRSLKRHLCAYWRRRQND